MGTLSRVTLLALLLAPAGAEAEERDPAAALVAGAGTDLVGFLVGGALLASAQADRDRLNTGWLVIEGGFALAPFTAHGAAGEWGRGAAFAIVPGAAFGSTAALFASTPNVVEHGSLPEQRWMWALFGVGLFASAAGVVDALLVAPRASSWRVRPLVGFSLAGVSLGGDL